MRTPTRRDSSGFVFVGGRLWLDFVNTDDEHHGRRADLLVDFDAWTRWLEAAGALDAERGVFLRRRGESQPMGATAALVDARRVRAALRPLTERGAALERAHEGAASERSREGAVAELNRVLARSAGTRRIEAGADGRFVRSFVAGGDAFAGLLLPIVESAGDSLVAGDLGRVRRCAAADCARAYLDATRNRSRRWCDMADCGNRAKAARHRRRAADAPTTTRRPAPTPRSTRVRSLRHPPSPPFARATKDP